ncbi:MaoC/PaaZ C-terminal domain-containing protein [Nocardia callitridis]|uniref:3-hydroxyacyl-thioester dehydratase HtdY n=1 Tax=Nocardia callitridis TaxID=648753 RepID=A0ABP9KL10_9NOCA
MTLHYANIGAEGMPWQREWHVDDTLLYNLSVGADASDPHLVTENSQGVGLCALPSFAAVLGGSLRSVRHLVGEFPSHAVVFVGQQLELFDALPVAGRIEVTTSIAEMTDRSTGVLLETEAVAVAGPAGRKLFTARASYFLRGLGSRPDSTGAPVIDAPRWATTLSVRTRTDQALLYRLCGDRNPLHSDPVVAKRAGFDRPVLHGLCTWAMVARTVIGHVLGAEVGAVDEIGGRLRHPAYPGEILTIDLVQTAECVLNYQARVADRIVLADGLVRTAHEVSL